MEVEVKNGFKRQVRIEGEVRQGQGKARTRPERGEGRDQGEAKTIVKSSQRQVTMAAKVEFESGFVGFLEAGEVRTNEDQTR